MKSVQLTENEVRNLCLKSREIFLSQPILLELEAPLKICGKLMCDCFSVCFEWDVQSVVVNGSVGHIKVHFNWHRYMVLDTVPITTNCQGRMYTMIVLSSSKSGRTHACSVRIEKGRQLTSMYSNFSTFPPCLPHFLPRTQVTSTASTRIS